MMETARTIQDRPPDFAVRVVKLCIHLDSKAGVRRTGSNQLESSETAIRANLGEDIGAQSGAGYLTEVLIACREARERLCWHNLLAATKIVWHQRLEGIIERYRLNRRQSWWLAQQPEFGHVEDVTPC